VGTAWEDPVKKRKQLTVFAGSSITGGKWSGVFSNAIKEFNRLSTAHALGVVLTQTTQAPDSNGPGGANVQFEAGAGSVNFTAYGQAFSVSVDGKALAGHTSQVMLSFNGVARIAKAFIVVPATPEIGDLGRRVAGDGVKLLIAVHELFHACGLSSNDHNPDDLFNGFPQAIKGGTPAEDRIEVNHHKRLPPLFLSSITIGAVQALWK
jgi:hypothetical protein